MRRYFLFLLILISLPAFSQQKLTRLEKAKQLIRKEFKETMNDYASYSPVSYGKVDSLFTSPFDDGIIKIYFDRAFEYREKAGITLDMTIDATPIIEAIEKEPEKYKAGVLGHIKLYESYRSMLMESISKYVPEFIGWKLTHKYRTKNIYNAVILKEQEFQFNKEMTELVNIKELDE